MDIDRAIRASQMALSRYKIFNHDIYEDASLKFLHLWKKGQDAYYYGTKELAEISPEVTSTLALSENFIHHSVDVAADRGRAVDERLVNPLTLRYMTGSSSGTALNVLYGINDLGVGTDGGGSVLYPAMALNLYGIILSGLGVKSSHVKQSTDGISFTPSTGFISQHWEVLKKAIALLTPLSADLNRGNQVPCDVYYDPRQWLDPIFQSVKSRLMPLCPRVLEFPQTAERQILLEFLAKEAKEGRVLLALERRIDAVEYCETIHNSLASSSQNNTRTFGKQWGRVINMFGGTGLSLPLGEAATGLLLFAGPGQANFNKILHIAEKLNYEYRPALYHRYFTNSLTWGV